MDLFDMYMLAEDNDQLYQQTIFSTLATRELKAQARSSLLPSININANTSTNRQVYGGGFNPSGDGQSTFSSHGYSWNLVQPLFRWDRYLELKKITHIIQQAEAEQISAQQNLIMRVTSSYFDILIAMDNLESAKLKKTSLDQQLEKANQQFAAGLIAITDVHEIQASFDSGVADYILRENLLNGAWENMREITDHYISKLATLSSSMPLSPPQPHDIDQWTEIAKSQNMDVIVSKHKVETMRHDVEKQKTQYWPTVDLVANYGENTTGGRFGGSSTENSDIGLKLNVPLYQGGIKTSKLKESKHRYNQSLAGLEQSLRAAKKDTRQAYLGIISGISRVKALQQAVISSETAFQATKTGLLAGTRTTVDVIVAEQIALDRKSEYLQAQYMYLLDSLRLKQAAGTLILRDLEQINHWLH